ncbi:MAG: dihydrodipicolinate synthase family protein [Planctomycetaceae bacterium]|jgi:4-hydroxy-tetrahydrodipicolinate synthase|nr:dihydrodipicolinate synthase family protein [Planctomycetaceae bacterium]MDP7276168.1 dihydrodipicolinate synthase family protein [Planctomycetaceae bacterium]
MAEQPVRGVQIVFQLPLHDDETVDFDTLGVEIDHVFEAGADGLVMAMVTEVLRLSDSERHEVARFSCQAAAGRGPVVVSVGAESSRLACGFAEQAQRDGAAAVMAIPPVSIGVDESQLRQYYERILQATSLPVIVQDASGYVGRPMSIALQAGLMERWGEDRVLFKPEANPIGPRLTALREATGGRARVFEGSGGIALLDSFRRGVVGTMPGADLVEPLVALWQSLEAGDWDRAVAISEPLTSLVMLQESLDSFLAVEKHILVRKGIFGNEIIRGPVGFVLDDETRAEVDRRYDRLMKVI